MKNDKKMMNKELPPGQSSMIMAGNGPSILIPNTSNTFGCGRRLLKNRRIAKMHELKLL
jgi:hypothetical protein